MAPIYASLDHDVGINDIPTKPLTAVRDPADEPPHVPGRLRRRTVPLDTVIRELGHAFSSWSLKTAQAECAAVPTKAVDLEDRQPGLCPAAPLIESGGMLVDDLVSSLGSSAFTLSTKFRVDHYVDGRPVVREQRPTTHSNTTFVGGGGGGGGVEDDDETATSSAGADGEDTVADKTAAPAAARSEACTAFVLTKRGTCYQTPAQSHWCEPGTVVWLRQVPTFTAFDKRPVDDYGVCILSVAVRRPGPAPAGADGADAATANNTTPVLLRVVGLGGAFVGREVIRYAYQRVPGDVVPLNLHQDRYWDRPAEQQILHIFNATAAEWQLPVLFTDVEVSYDRNMVKACYHANVWFDLECFGDHFTGILKPVRFYFVPTPGSLDLSLTKYQHYQAMSKGDDTCNGVRCV